nr:integrase core domain-containing protein [Streptomyces sp. NRRL S-15]
MFSSPGTPNTTSTPSFSRQRTRSSAAPSGVCFRCSASLTLIVSSPGFWPRRWAGPFSRLPRPAARTPANRVLRARPLGGGQLSGVVTRSLFGRRRHLAAVQSEDTALLRRGRARAALRRPVESKQYTSQQFASLAAEFGVRLSVGRTGQCWDNALAESFFSTIERELLGTSVWPSRAAARTAIFDFIEGWDNLHRLHSSLGYLSPAASTGPHSQPDHHTNGVRQSGTSPLQERHDARPPAAGPHTQRGVCHR